MGMDRDRAIRACALLVVLAAGCSNLPDIVAGECGNQVLEAGEDCDGPSAYGEGTTCAEADDADNACHYVCDGTACPAGWGCGTDNRCRQHAGGFIEAVGSPWPFDVDEFAIGDVDGDEVPDLLGNDETSLSARFGDGDGAFPGLLEVLGREATGPVTYTQFDADARMDALVPTATGLFALRGQANRTLDPIAYSPFEVPLDGPYRITPLESDRSNSTTEVLLIRTPSTGPPSTMSFLFSALAPVPLPDGHATEELTARLPVADLDADGRDEIALAFTGADRVYIYSSTGAADGGDLGLSLWQEVQLGGTILDGAHFAYANADGTLDLLVSVGDGINPPWVEAAYGDGSRGGLAAPRAEPVFASPGGWPLAAVGGFQWGFYVYPYATYVAYWSCPACDPSAAPEYLFPVAYPATNYWSEGAFGDFNGDLQVDFAAIVADSEAIDVYLNTGGGWLFNRFHVDTDSPPRGMRVGDYDGDLVHDVAFVAAGQGVSPDGLSVIFGAASSGPSAAVSMGRTGFIEALEPLSATLTDESVDGVTDLFAVSASFPDYESRAIAVMQGSSSRRMISPFALIPNPDVPFPDVPLRALVGDFNEDGSRDVGAVAVRFYDVTTGDPSTRFLFWGIPGKGENGDLNAATDVNVPLAETGDFYPWCASWATGDIDGDGQLDVVGIDGGILCASEVESAAPRIATGSLGTDALVTTAGPLPATDLRVVIDVELADMDADGDLDLVVLAIGDIFVPGPLEGEGPEIGTAEGRGLVVLWNDGSGGFASPTEIDLEGTFFAVDVASVDLAPGQPRSLVLYSDSGVLLARPDPDAAPAFLPAEPVFWTGGEGRVKAADLDRDGLVDLAIGNDGHIYVLLGQPAPHLGGEDVDGRTEPQPQ